MTTTTTKTLTWITTEDTWLTEEESLNNAQLVAYYFVDKGWTPHAISALCGNMRHESSINPNIWEFGYGHSLERGYGLVQWTPATKYINWATEQGLDYTNANNQLARIDYEKANDIQWITKESYPLSFDEFTQSTLSPTYLTEVFCWNYERPNQEAGEESMSSRQAFAERCYLELDFSGAGGGGGGGDTDDSDSVPIFHNSKTLYQYEEETPLVTYYQVKKGDTLTAIAKHYGVYLNDILEVSYSEIKDKNKIEVGDILLLPKAKQKLPTSNTAITYVVKKGDTLSDIARRYNTSTAILKKKNNLRDVNKIYVGQVLKI